MPELSEIKKEQDKQKKLHNLAEDPIDSGRIVNRRRSFFKRILDEIKPEEDESILSYVFFKILLPSAIHTAQDSLNAAIDIFFTGSASNRSSSRSDRAISDGNTDYGRIYGKKHSSTSLSTVTMRRTKSYRDYLTFTDDFTARKVWDHLQGCIDEEGTADLEDLLLYLGHAELIDWNSASNGWTSLKGTQIRRLISGNYELVLPRLEKL